MPPRPTGPTNAAWQNAGFLVPDIVFNVRADQAWGGAQVAAILHDNRARYYNTTANGVGAGTAGHPGDKWGWAVSAGLELNLPFAKGDTWAVQSQYCARIWLGAWSTSGCADWAAWQVGSRTIWNPVRNLDVGVEALYTDLSKSAFNGAKIAFTPTGTTAPASVFTSASTHVAARNPYSEVSEYGLRTWRGETWRGAYHRAGHFGPDPLTPIRMTPVITVSFIR